MKILSFEHADTENMGSFKDYFLDDGHEITSIAWHKGETPDTLEGYDGLWVMGGSMNVWEEDKYPWLMQEKALIKEAVGERGMPYFGICLGHQLLADALGGTVAKAEKPEIGIMEVQQTQVGFESVIQDALPAKFMAVQWHGAEVTQMPAGARCFATSPNCAVQAMQWETRAYSTQFHAEAELNRLHDWLDVPEVKAAMIDEIGEDGIQQMETQFQEHAKAMLDQSERLYMNWLQMTARTF